MSLAGNDQQALLNEVLYTLRNGQLGFEAGINLIKGTIVNMTICESLQFHTIPKCFLSQTLPNGVRLTYQGDTLTPL